MPTATQIFSKAKQKELTDLIAGLDEAMSEISVKFQELEPVVEAINGAIQTYNGLLAEFGSFRDDIVSQIEETIDEKSEKWQEGDVGQSWVSWKDTWESLDLSELDEIEMPSEPEGLDTGSLEL